MDDAQRQRCLEQAMQGDPQALGPLLDSLRPYVRLLVRTLRDPQVQARVGESDLIQDAMLEIHRSFAAFHGNSVGELIGWLRPIVLRSTAHVLRRHRAARKRSVALEETGSDLTANTADRGTSPSEQVIRLEQASRLAEALDRLPDDMREVLLARHADDEPHAVIAERMGRSEGAIRVLYTRALQRLRELCRE
jgi:RNA polymerase sigma-70 factor (ECF subfamily)